MGNRKEKKQWREWKEVISGTDQESREKVRKERVSSLILGGAKRSDGEENGEATREGNIKESGQTLQGYEVSIRRRIR